MGILGLAFTKAAVGGMVDAGQSQGNDLFGDMISHMSDVGNIGSTPSRKGGRTLG